MGGLMSAQNEKNKKARGGLISTTHLAFAARLTPELPARAPAAGTPERARETENGVRSCRLTPRPATCGRKEDDLKPPG